MMLFNLPLIKILCNGVYFLLNSFNRNGEMIEFPDKKTVLALLFLFLGTKELTD